MVIILVSQRRMVILNYFIMVIILVSQRRDFTGSGGEVLAVQFVFVSDVSRIYLGTF